MCGKCVGREVKVARLGDPWVAQDKKDQKK